jgi:hypothetical protein
MHGNAEAVGSFTTMGAYLPADEGALNREDAEVAGLSGSFTYDGNVSEEHFYLRGAYWLIAENRFGILAYGTPLSPVNTEKLRELIESMDLSILQGTE